MMLNFLETQVLFGAFYLIYRIWLKQHQSYVANRFFLLGSILFSVLVPQFSFESLLQSGPSITSDLRYVLPQLSIEGATVQHSSINWVMVIYLVITALFLLRFLLGFRKLHVLKKQSLGSFEGYSLWLIPEGKGVFSFGKSIYVDSEKVETQILKHEVAHLSQLHMLDKLLVETVLIFCWINPFVWLLSIEINENLEYLADKQLSSEENFKKEDYLALVLRKNSGFRASFVTNFYQKSIAYKRCKALLTNQKSTLNLMRNLALIPVLMLAFYITACDKNGNQQREEIEIERTIDEPLPDEQLISFPGGQEKMMMFFAENVNYPQEAKEQGVEGKSFVRFLINEKGELIEADIEKSSGNELLDAEALRVVNSMPKWDSKVTDPNAELNVELIIPIMFKLPKK